MLGALLVVCGDRRYPQMMFRASSRLVPPVFRLAPVLLFVPILVLAGYACGGDGDDSGTTPTTPTDDSGSSHETSTPTDAPSDGGVSPAIYKSGTRLRAQVLRVGDAAKFETFVDTARNEPCSFAPMPDGSARCLPGRIWTHYSDADCKTPIAIVQTCSEDVKYVTKDTLGYTCGRPGGGSIEMFELGPVTTAANYYEKQGDGQCVNQGTPFGPVHSLGKPIALTAFVAADAANANVSTTVAIEKWMGEDGSELVTGELFDRGRNERCKAQRIGGPSSTDQRCIQSNHASSDDFRGPYVDGTCTELAAYRAFPASCPPPTVIIHFEQIPADGGPGCEPGQDFSLFAVGAPLASAFRTMGPGGACGPVNFGTTYHRRGAALPPSSFPALVTATEGSGPVGVRAVTAEGARLTIGDLWDTTRGVCTPEKFADGKTYCVPASTRRNRIRVFRDAGCAQPVMLAEGRCSTAKEVILEESGQCSNVTYGNTVTTLGAIVDVAEYWEDIGMGCTGPIPNGSGVANEITGTTTVSAAFTQVERVTE